MKYMGSKRAMLQNGLGDVLAREVGLAGRFVDLFSGSGAVAVHVAQRYEIPVLAFDLQRFSAVLAGAVIKRNATLDSQDIWQRWEQDAKARLKRRRVLPVEKVTRAVVAGFRTWCSRQVTAPITAAYGGHYFSPRQAVWIDSLRATLPQGEPARTVALAALVQAASECAAAPGHTAQPFQPTRTGKHHLEELWRRDVVQRTKHALAALSDKFAKKRGRAQVADANDAVRNLREGDLAFIDPPYSGVQYSRFYHVLETIVRGDCGTVSGVGRYPAPDRRPHSNYSLKTKSAAALDELLWVAAARRARAILTFPDHECSNGLSGGVVREIASRHFRISEWIVHSKFSSLGGTGDDRNDEAGRAPLRAREELMLVLEPR